MPLLLRVGLVSCYSQIALLQIKNFKETEVVL